MANVSKVHYKELKTNVLKPPPISILLLLFISILLLL